MWWLLSPVGAECTWVTGRGEFFCPNCDARRKYERRAQQVRLDILFIAVIPWGPKTERVHCLTCQSAFQEDQLRSDLPSTRHAAALRHALRRTAVQFMRAGGQDPAERQAFQQAHLALTGEPLDDGAVEAEIARAAADPRSLPEHLAAAAPHLRDAAKEGLLKAALAVAAPGGPLSAEERTLLSELGAALQMSAAHVQGILLTAAPPPADDSRDS
jgi:tellurite resistance protein